MTREEHIERARDEVYTVDMWGDGGVRLSDVIDRIHTIYDDFESRTCESCKFCYSAPERHLVKCKMWGIMVRDEMKCNKWEKKQ